MKKLLKYSVVLLASLSLFSCKNTLTVSSPSVVDGDFVFGSYETAKTVLLGAYNTYLQCNTNSEGLFCNWDNMGSDVERCSIGASAAIFIAGAQLYLNSTEDYQITNAASSGIWDRMYSVIAKCNQVIYYIEGFDNFEQIKSSAPNDWSDLLGQAYALRATMYYDLVRYFGDALYIDTVGMETKELSSRDFIIENEIENLIGIENLMYTVGQNGHLSDQMTRNYVDGLIGRLCFMEAGYQTRRTDLGTDFYTDKDGKPLSFETWGSDDSRGAAYNRRSDWKNFYTKALPYLEKAVNQPGGVILTTTDPRSDDKGRVYGNPFQYYFNTVNDQKMAEETIYELTMKGVGGSSRIAYNYGRGCDAGSPALPPKSNAQTSSYPEVYYGIFDPQDMRRDASLTVTSSHGNGTEIINTFSLGNKTTGGIHMNKYDLNRQANPDPRQLNSGISFVQMRQADVILMLAEAYAQTGETGKATTELRKIHDRAFADDIQDAKFNDLLAANGGNLVDAIFNERQLEFVGEGLRRWDLVRSGKMPEVAVNFRKNLIQTIDDLKAKGYHEYANGNVISNWIWTKAVNAKVDYGYRLTMQTPPGKEDDPVLYPGWRGQHDDWAAVKASAISQGINVSTVPVEDYTNLAIKGLFKYIDPEGAEAKALEADGYAKTVWGIDMYTDIKVDVERKTESPDRLAEWSTKFFGGYSDADYAAKKAPIYLNPMQYTTIVTTGLTNGYGFPDK